MGISQEAVDRLKKALLEMADSIANILTELLENIDWGSLVKAATFITQSNDVMNSCANGRIKHLALYAKKKRVRKKNMNRIRREL